MRVRHQLEKAANSVRSSAKVRDDGLSQAFEFAAGPFAVFGVIGAFVSFFYRYQAETARLDEGKPWTRRTH